jgi:hypothetical protein
MRGEMVSEVSARWGQHFQWRIVAGDGWKQIRNRRLRGAGLDQRQKGRMPVFELGTGSVCVVPLNASGAVSSFLDDL